MPEHRSLLNDITQVNPETGIAMKTMFNIEASDFQDEDVPLSYSFGYRHLNSENVRWFKKISSSVPTVRSLLPSSKQGILMVLDVCDSFDTCTKVESQNSMTVKFEELSIEDIT